MKIFGLTVGKDEEHRYLESMLENASKIFDAHFFYDDQSSDNTVTTASKYCSVVVRPSEAPSFLENEGGFRAHAWAVFELIMKPQVGDWVLAIDCDELLVSRTDSTRFTLAKVISEARHLAVNLNIPEVFGFDDDGCPLVRVDRLWGTIHAPRLFRYQPGGSYPYKEMGSPAVPGYVMASPWDTTEDLALLHYGYADEHDAAVKYKRYSSLPGHSNDHVQSILTEDKTLVRWGWPHVGMVGWRA